LGFVWVEFWGGVVDLDEDEVEGWIDSWIEVRREKMIEGGRMWNLTFGLPPLFYELMHSCIVQRGAYGTDGT